MQVEKIPMFGVSFVQIGEESTVTMKTGYRSELEQASHYATKSSQALIDLVSIEIIDNRAMNLTNINMSDGFTTND